MSLKHIVVHSLGILIVSALFLVSFVFWPIRTSSAQGVAPATTASTEAEQGLKEKLDNYGKRADDLQKLISLLLGVSTIYAVVLGISAYTSVQSNLKQSEKEVGRLQGLISQYENELKQNQAALPAMREEIKEGLDYAARIAIARLITMFPFEGTQEELTSFRHDVIKRLLETRRGRYTRDSYLNFAISRLYKLLNLHESAEEAMNRFIAEKEQEKEFDDALRDAYYNRACYQSLRWKAASAQGREALQVGIERDLIFAFSLDESYRVDARKDPDFADVLTTDWFTGLVRA